MNPSTSIRTSRSFVKRYSLVLFFALAFLFTWANWLPRAMTDRGLLEVQVPGYVELIAGYGPALVAILVAGLAHGRDGLRELFGRLARWRVGLRWYLVALLLRPALQLGALALHLILSQETLSIAEGAQIQFGPEGLPLWGQALVLFLIFILGFDGLGEELGWRGYALPRLLEKRGALISSLILGVFWALWHVPYMLSTGSALAERPFLLFLLNVLGQSILFTWLYRNTRGSVLLAILFHASGNTIATMMDALIPSAGDPQVYVFGTLLIWLPAIAIIFRWNRHGKTEIFPERRLIV